MSSNGAFKLIFHAQFGLEIVGYYGKKGYLLAQEELTADSKA